jgi:aerotaxis receptor
MEYKIGDSTILVLLGDKTSKFVYANPAYLEASGYSWEDLKGTATPKMVHPDTPKQVMMDMVFTLGKKQPWTGIIKNRRKNGDFYWVRLNIMPVYDRQGKFAGSLMAHSQPSVDEIAAVEPMYKSIREGMDQRLAVRFGRVVRANLLYGVVEKFRMFGLNGLIWGSIAAIDLSGLLFGLAVSTEAANFRFWALALGFLAATGVVGLVLSRCIVAPLRDVAQFAYRIAACDLTSQMTSTRSNEIGHIIRALTQMVVNMRATVLDVRDSAQLLQEATSEIASGAVDLSAQADMQASNLQRTAASMEEITSTVENNAGAANEANQLASSASRTAESGGFVVNDVIATMAGITESSRKIADIITVIDGIAFQTNILALNAAVEAARAGEHGRGFAVVAAEVRDLSNRTAKSAREVRQLIRDSVRKVDDGSSLVSNAGKTMEDIVTQVKRVTTLVGDIANASTEQSAGVGQINQSLAELDQTTHRNAAVAEESAASAKAMAAQAKGLVDAVSIFRLAEGA